MSDRSRPSDDFSLLEQGTWGGLLALHGRLARLIERDLLDRHRISHAEFEVLLQLSWADDHRSRLQDLAAQSLLTRSGISRVVERLGRVELVTRERPLEDRRGTYAILTDRGLETLRAALRDHVTLVRAQFLDRFSHEELEQMQSFWRRADGALS